MAKGKRKGDYGILDWGFSSVKPDDLKSIDKVQNRIDSFARKSVDGGQRWRDFKNNVDWTNKTSKGGIRISQQVENRNLNYSAQTKQRIKGLDLEPLKDLKIDKDFEDETVDEVITAQEERIEILERRSIKAKREFGREARDRIRAIKDVDEFLEVGEELQARGEEIGILKPRSVFGVELDRKRDELLEKARTEQ